MNKKMIMVALVLGIGATSCKKVVNNYAPEYAITSSNTITDKSLVSDNSTWTLVEMPVYGPTTTKRYFKFELNGKFIVIDKQESVDPYYWKTDTFFVGAKFSGTFVKSLM